MSVIIIGMDEEVFTGENIVSEDTEDKHEDKRMDDVLLDLLIIDDLDDPSER